MAIVRRTADADDDLRQIAEHIANDNPSAALAWLDATAALFLLLATQPKIGQRRKSRRLKALRQHAHGNYVVYYRALNDGIEVLRVLHGAREPRGQI